MSANTATELAFQVHHRKLLAPLWHTLGLLFLLAVPLVSGVYLQLRGGSSRPLLAEHSSFFFIVQALIYEFLLISYTYWGLRKGGERLQDLIGGRWRSWTGPLVDVGLGLAFLLVFQIAVQVLVRIIGADAKSLASILPDTPTEKLLWVLLSVTAGFVEEVVLRGYLQLQIVRLGAPTAIAILAQSVIFGAGHFYEGPRSVLVISIFGMFAGLLATWRKSLRPGIVGHALTDLLVLLQRAT